MKKTLLLFSIVVISCGHTKEDGCPGKREITEKLWLEQVGKQAYYSRMYCSTWDEAYADSVGMAYYAGHDLYLEYVGSPR